MSITKYNLIILSIVLMVSCVEPFDATTEDFESVLVIDAVITNEVKQQKVQLSRTYRFEEGLINESGATVIVSVDGQGQYTFTESEPGIYLSTTEFAALPNVSYQLYITTRDGSSYTSDEVTLTQNVAIDNLSATVKTDDLNGEGVGILLNAFDPSGNSGYYRFEYEETFKIIAPFWNPQDLVVVSESPPIFEFEARPREQQVCYNTQRNLSLILANTTGFSEDRLTDFVVRFIPRNNYIISHRYSILVRQYVISRDAHAFYEALSELSGLESIFSENQPGFIQGNFRADNNPNERVIGFFDVSSVSEERIFFNYEDLFPEQPLPDYPNDCTVTAPLITELVSSVKNNTIKYFGENDDEDAPPGTPYNTVVRACGDCTALGVSTPPSFWIE